jgi:DNA-binding GntR family transcriptional regulator
MLRIVLDPLTVARCLKHTTEAEDAEIEALVDSVEDEAEKCALVSEWLLKRFPQLGVSIRNSMAAKRN